MSVAIEFDHSIGYSLVPGGLCFHPNGEDYVFCAGGNIVIGKLTDPHEQYFLRSHDDYITTMSLSPLGNLIASGQQGVNSNVLIWDYVRREVLFSFEEHDSSIKHVAFSHDERILASLGDKEDKKMILWDLSNGYIIAAKNNMPNGSTCICHGGFVKDVKRRDTNKYLLASGGAEGLAFWYLDPYSGELEMEVLASDARGSLSRHITAISFYDNNDNLCATTTSGDFLLVNIRSKKMLKAVSATRLGLGAVLCSDRGILVGGGDSSIKLFDDSQRLQSQVQLDGSVVAMSFSPDKLEVLLLMT